MYRIIGFASILAVACLVSASAQSGNDSMKKNEMGKQESMTGCIAEKDGKYMLMDRVHPTGIQLMSSDDLKPHVGHKVKVTGMREKMDASGHDSIDESMKHDGMDLPEMKVNGLKMVSEQCDMSQMTSK